MIQQEILKGLTLSVGNGGMSLNLEPKAKITKRDGGVFLNGVLVPFISVNKLPEGEVTAAQLRRILLTSIKTAELKKGDAAWA